MFVRVFAIAASAACISGAAAACTTSETGAKCLEAVSVDTAPAYAPGDALPRGQYYMLLNTEYFGMPPAADGWVYYRVDGRIFRVRARTLEVIEDVTHLANAAF